MKIHSLFLAISFSFITFSASSAFSEPGNVTAETIRLSEPVSQTAKTETFGAVPASNLPVVSLAQLLTEPENFQNKAFQLETEILKVCQKKGCFFIAREAQHTVRVAFRDYGFFVPTDSNGKRISLTGELVQKERSEKQAAHFNKDLKAGNTFKAGMIYEIVADSVTLPKG